MPFVTGLLLAGVLLWQITRVEEDRQDSQRHRNVVSLAREVKTNLLDMETGIRGYLLTDKKEFLEPYSRAAPNLKPSAHDLLEGSMVSSNSYVLSKKIGKQAVHWADLADDFITDKERNKPISVSSQEARKLELDEIRRNLDFLIATEESAWQKRQADETNDQRTLLWTLLVGALGVGGLMAYGTSALLHALSSNYEAALHRYEKLAATMEKQVQARTADLERANKELEAFSYTVSHDLRAPLRSVASFSLILQEDLADKLDADSKDNLSRVQAAAKKMTQLIDALLRFSRIARARLEVAPVDLSQMAEAVAGDLKRSAPEREVEFIIEPGLTDEADPHLIHAVLENLLENAWKFTSKSEHVRIEFKRDPDSGAYCVSDNGVGFEEEYVDKIFLPFERLHAEKEFPGTGIGLASAKRVIERHGGRIWAETDLGKGTTVCFTLGGNQPARGMVHNR